LIDDFAEDEQKIIQLKMAGYSQNDIATQLRCSERTVRRKLKVILKQLESLID
jgi:RNA polymerase sigma factor (sigma-70 family)